MSKRNGFARPGAVGFAADGRSIPAGGANAPKLPSESYRRPVASRRIAALLAATTVVLAATAGGAEAAPYQKWVGSNCNGTYTSCQIVMEPAVPANKRVQVTSVACVVRIPQNAQIQWLVLQKNPGAAGTVVEHLAPTRTNSGAPGSGYYVYNGQTLFHASAGDSLQVAVWATGDISLLQCKIAGAIVNLP